MIYRRSLALSAQENGRRVCSLPRPVFPAGRRFFRALSVFAIDPISEPFPAFYDLHLITRRMSGGSIRKQSRGHFITPFGARFAPGANRADTPSAPPRQYHHTTFCAKCEDGQTGFAAPSGKTPGPPPGRRADAGRQFFRPPPAAPARRKRPAPLLHTIRARPRGCRAGGSAVQLTRPLPRPRPPAAAAHKS